MFRNVVAALNEALDITMHLKPLTQHFEVRKQIRKEYFALDQEILIPRDIPFYVQIYYIS